MKRIKILYTIQRQYETLGISSSNQPTQSNSFSKRVLFGFLVFECVIISQFVYIFYVADGFMEYMEGSCAAAASIIVFVCFAAIAFQKTTLFESIDNFEKLIGSSKSTVWNRINSNIFIIQFRSSNTLPHLSQFDPDRNRPRG